MSYFSTAASILRSRLNCSHLFLYKFYSYRKVKIISYKIQNKKKKTKPRAVQVSEETGISLYWYRSVVAIPISSLAVQISLRYYLYDILYVTVIYITEKINPWNFLHCSFKARRAPLSCHYYLQIYFVKIELAVWSGPFQLQTFHVSMGTQIRFRDGDRKYRGCNE